MNRSERLDFTEFFAAESAPLLRMCWALTLDREQARDVAQETMARAWRDWDRLGHVDPEVAEDAGPRSWCRAVALNLVRGNWRRRRTELAYVPPVAEPAGLAAADLDLRDALGKLSVRQREAVVLHHLLDLSVATCAELMGLGESTVKEHLQRGRTQLSALLGVHAAGPNPIEGDPT